MKRCDKAMKFQQTCSMPTILRHAIVFRYNLAATVRVFVLPWDCLVIKSQLSYT